MNESLLRGLAKIDSQTVAVTDYEMLNECSARVLVRCTGNLTKAKFYEKLQASLAKQASPLQGSFKWMPGTDRTMAVGFVTLTPEIRAVEDLELKAKYRAVAATANIFMDPEDETMWELNSGAGGSFLKRTRSESLPAVLSSCKTSTASRYEKLSASVESAELRTHDFASFVIPYNGSAVVDYGSVVGVNKKTGAIIMYSSTLDQRVDIDPDLVVLSMRVDPNAMLKVTAGFPDVNAVIEYYKKAYPHGKSSGYLDKLIDQVTEQAAA